MLSSSAKKCFNSSCKSTPEKWRRGWRRRTGDYANLCDPCGYAYEEGKFCEIFHSNNSGWRCCESCGKQIHCGCIVSFHMFVLLDAGGIECITCSKRSYILSPNPTWPPPSHFLTSQPEKIEDFSMKTLNARVSSGPVQWHRSPSSINGSDIQPDVKPLMPFEINMSRIPDRFNISERLSVSPPEMKQESTYERVVKGKLSCVPSEVRQCGSAAGVNIKEQHSSFIYDWKPMFQRNDDSSSNMSLGSSFSKSGTDITHLSAVLSQLAVAVNPSGKQPCNHNGNDSSGKCPLHDEKIRGDGGGQNQLMPYKHLQITNKGLQQISDDSKRVTTPLFEKILSASDARRVGRLVVPKKCAEAYFPPITYPDGVPIKVQDVRGNEWVLQFRFWTNYRSRMYVLEGITPCIESMHLRAGDVVAFSRLNPEGKLIISGRKTSPTPLSQVDDATVMSNEASRPSNGSAGNKERPIVDKFLSNGRRRNGFFSSKRKRLRNDNENVIELEITWKEAQALMRPPSETVPSITVVDGCEFEEFQDSVPLIGRPTIVGMDQLGESFQWVHCEDCFKWRKVPSDALLPLRWICSDNIWDQDRSLCSAAEELSREQLELLLSASSNKDSSETEDTTKHHRDPFAAIEELDTPVQMDKEGPSSSLDRARTEHPHHKPECECVACICLKRRFRTLMEGCAAKKCQREVESKPQRLLQWQGVEDTKARSTSFNRNSSCQNIDNVKDSSPALPLKCQIDLNIQPEREEEESSSPDSSRRFFTAQTSSLSPYISGSIIEKQMQ